MINPYLSKILSESLLSLYPVFVKNINLPIDIQLWARLITYVMISLFFITFSFVSKNILTIECIGLALVNLVHIYTSYEGFTNLDSGVSFSIFNVYPLLILLFSGVLWKPAYLLAILGLGAFVIGNYIDLSKTKSSKTENKKFYFGIIMIILAAITEAIMYFMIRNVPTENSWNHVFISYFLGSIIMTWYIFSSGTKKVVQNLNWYTVGIALLINGIIGSLGYFLRFYSSYRLEPSIYAMLSYTGIIMAYVYGFIFNKEGITVYKVLGTILIILSNYLI
jgi:drug/metabolite transporter (DMT)-like permease